MGFGYWWGHARWDLAGATPENRGQCIDNNSDYHGEFGADCSGFVSKIWGFPEGNSDVYVDRHGPGTGAYAEDRPGSWWTVDYGELTGADALVYRDVQQGAGHIVLFAGFDHGGNVVSYECRGCAYGCMSVKRTFDELLERGYHGIRRVGW